VVLSFAMVAAAALAGWSWCSAVRANGPFRPREATLLVAWAVCSGVARLVDLLPESSAKVSADLLLLTASSLALVAVAGVVRRISSAIGGLGASLAEAGLNATSLVTLAWVLTGGPLRPPAAALLSAAPALIDLATSALILRLAMLVPEAVSRAANRRRLLLCAAAICLVGGGNGLQGLDGLGVRTPSWIIDLVIVLGYLLAALVPRIRNLPSATSRSVSGLRVLPYVLVSSAIVAVCLQALLGTTGPVPVVLVTFVVASLVLLQACTLSENDQLVNDLTLSRQRLTALVENTSDLIVRLDGNGRVLAANAAAIRLLHRTPQSLSGRSFDDLARAEDRRLVREAVLDVTRGRKESAQVELRLAPPATGTAQLRLRAVPGGAVANLNDVTDSVELRQRLERLARYDQMTGLVNRSHLLEVIGAWLAEPEADVAVLYADLDGFKGVNDRFGHGAGDRVLTDVASRFEALAGAVDARRVILGRVGGDEFIMGMEGISLDAARMAAQRVVEAITPPFVMGDRTVQLGVSVGLAGSGPAHGPPEQSVRGGETGASELVHRADLAMYAAKGSGRAQVATWEPELEERARRRMDIAIGLRAALDTNRLAVAYQPIVRLSDGVVVGAEALLRLPPGIDPAALAPGLDDLVSPAELVAVAEDNGTILEMGEWVLAQAAQQAAEWAACGYQASVSVNMSVQQLVSPHFVDSVRTILRSYGLPPGRLVLELTESQLVGQTGPALQTLERLRATGVRLAIDDFGTGYSSLSYLRHMPVQLVKLDRMLLDDIGIDPRATALARSVVSMARDLGLLVVAEGMEDMASVRLLRDLGAYAGQGFALSPALPADQMAQVLAGPPLDLGVSVEPGELGPRELGPRELGSGNQALRPQLALGSEPDSLASRLPSLDPLEAAPDDALEEMPADPLPSDPLPPDPEEVDLDATVIEERSSRLR
jgi:diguanylate cyclase (GGDEF)-like protein/PAS domain S-box-containing protein